MKEKTKEFLEILWPGVVMAMVAFVGLVLVSEGSEDLCLVVLQQG